MTALRADRSRAAVLGGGLAGLLAASILSKHFARVLVIERDRYPEEALHRNGVPQAHHVHGLLLRGLQILEELFPGIRGDLARAGAGLLDSASDILWLTPAGLAPRHESGLPFLACSRPLIDHVVRRRVCRLGNVEF